MEGNKIMRDIDQPLPGDVSANRRTSRMPADLARRKSAYFESEFAASSKDPDPAKFRVRNEAIVMAELKTNVIVRITHGLDHKITRLTDPPIDR